MQGVAALTAASGVSPTALNTVACIGLQHGMLTATLQVIKHQCIMFRNMSSTVMLVARLTALVLPHPCCRAQCQLQGDLPALRNSYSSSGKHTTAYTTCYVLMAHDQHMYYLLKYYLASLHICTIPAVMLWCSHSLPSYSLSCCCQLGLRVANLHEP